MATDGARARWYVMLFPRRRGPVACLQELAALTGGEPSPDPHVTIAYLEVATHDDPVTGPLRTLTGPPVPLHASHPFSFQEEPHPLFGHTLSLRVERTAALQAWQDAVHAALTHAGLAPDGRWRSGGLHLQAVRHMAVPPAEALARLRGRAWQVEFVATTLIATQRIGDTFRHRLEYTWGPGGDA